MFVVLLGGVRSGKSRLAVDLATRSTRPVVFVATAEARDEHMAQRISAHQAERPTGWATVEAPLDPIAAVGAAPPHHFVVVDCATVWVSNLLLAGTPDEQILDAAADLGGALAGHPGGAVVVTNEVGMGVHPSSDLGRHYRDLLGAVNVRLVDASDRALVLVAGRALELTDPWEALA